MLTYCSRSVHAWLVQLKNQTELYNRQLQRQYFLINRTTECRITLDSVTYNQCMHITAMTWWSDPVYLWLANEIYLLENKMAWCRSKLKWKQYYRKAIDGYLALSMWNLLLSVLCHIHQLNWKVSNAILASENCYKNAFFPRTIKDKHSLQNKIATFTERQQVDDTVCPPALTLTLRSVGQQTRQEVWAADTAGESCMSGNRKVQLYEWQQKGLVVWVTTERVQLYEWQQKECRCMSGN